ncbi:c-type cytochrome [Sphingopyxis sp.]|jgi:cytochrome c|uniref:c-type cytochrome n=1 Tax=Sphingopyxis sp. TaxID=1908224 RepID=UPI002DF6EA87|nr:c-type cytochrome [Sphingopyxis sp.]
MKLFAVSLLSAAAIGLATAGPSGKAMAQAAPPAFAVCAACHKVSADGANSVGPNLRGIVGKKAASKPKYAYSPALKKSVLVWNPENLDRWLAGPTKLVPGSKMVTAVPNAANRKAIIAYLATLK